jgi:hypothetical protein
MNYWTAEELDKLKENSNKSLSYLQNILPNRSKKAIQKTRRRYNFGPLHRIISDWTEEELKILQEKGRDFLSTELVKWIPRHSPHSIASKLSDLGIKKTSECRTRLGRIGQSCVRTDALLKLEQFDFNQLDNKTSQILLGSLLGDGFCLLPTNGKSFIFSERHSFKQKDYVIWKKDMLKVFKPNYTESHGPTITTPAHQIFGQMRQSFYGNKKNKCQIPLDIIDKIDYLSLMIWYLDDGYLGRPKSGLKSTGRPRRTYPHIIAKGYNLEDLEKLSEVINSKLNIQSYLKTHKHCGSLNKLLCFNNDKKKLFSIWSEFARNLSLPECMFYKLNNLKEDDDV